MRVLEIRQDFDGVHSTLQSSKDHRRRDATDQAAHDLFIHLRRDTITAELMQNYCDDIVTLGLASRHFDTHRGNRQEIEEFAVAWAVDAFGLHHKRLEFDVMITTVNEPDCYMQEDGPDSLCIQTHPALIRKLRDQQYRHYALAHDERAEMLKRREDLHKAERAHMKATQLALKALEEFCEHYPDPQLQLIEMKCERCKIRRADARNKLRAATRTLARRRRALRNAPRLDVAETQWR